MNAVLRQLRCDAILISIAVLSAASYGVSVCVGRREVPAVGELLLGDSTVPLRRLALRRGNEEVHLTQDERTGSWVAESTHGLRGESTAIGSALAALKNVRVLRRIERTASTEMSRLGLDPPKFVWTLGSGKHVSTLEFGTEVPGAPRGVYVAIRSTQDSRPRVYAADANLAAVSLSPEQLVDPVLVPWNETDYGEIEFSSPRSQFHLRRNRETGRWFEVGGATWRLEPESVSRLLRELRSLRTAPRSSLPAAEHGSFSGALKVRLRSGEVSIDFIGSCPGAPGLVRTRATQSTTMECCTDVSKLGPLLTRGLTRDTRLFSLRVDEVEGLKTSIQDELADLRREGTGFTFGNHGRLALEAGNDYLSKLLGIRGQIVSAEQLSVLAPFATSQYVRLRSAVVGTRDEYEEGILVGPAGLDGGRFVRRFDDGAVLRIDPTAAALFRTKERLAVGLSTDAGHDGAPEP